MFAVSNFRILPLGNLKKYKPARLPPLGWCQTRPSMYDVRTWRGEISIEQQISAGRLIQVNTQDQTLDQRSDAVVLCFMLQRLDITVSKINVSSSQIVQYCCKKFGVPVNKNRSIFVFQTGDSATQQCSEEGVRNPHQRLP